MDFLIKSALFTVLMISNNIKSMEEGITNSNNNSNDHGPWKKQEVTDPKSIGLDIKEIKVDYAAPNSHFGIEKPRVKQEDEIKVGPAELFIPPGCTNPDELILLPIVHGTWGRQTDAFRKYTEQEKKEAEAKPRSKFKSGPVFTNNFEHIKRFAEFLANANGTPLELLPFSWSGFNSDEARMTAGKALAAYIKGVPRYRGAKIYIIAHSHGCTSVSHALQKITAEMVIFLGYPVRSIQDQFKPIGAKKVVYVHSKGDLVVNGAQFSAKKFKGELSTLSNKTITGAKITVGLATGGLAYGLLAASNLSPDLRPYFAQDLFRNIIDGGARGMKFIAIGATLKATDIALSSISSVTKKKKLKPTAAGQIVACLNITINEQHPGHSELINSVEHMGKIVDALERVYPVHYSQNSHFNLNIIDKVFSPEEQVFLSVVPETSLDVRPRQDFIRYDGTFVDIKTLPIHTEYKASERVQRDYEKLLNSDGYNDLIEKHALYTKMLAYKKKNKVAKIDPQKFAECEKLFGKQEQNNTTVTMEPQEAFADALDRIELP
ncbi:MAG: hypothetical protein WC707_00125 [Candidatus Babeliaceae bacterium]